MSAGFAALVAAIGLCGSFLSGLLGIGGAIVIYPMLYHLPPLLGVGQLTAYQVSAATVLQVLASSLSGTVAQRRSPHLNRRVVGVLGGGAAAGGLVGGYASGLLPDAAVHGAYGLLAALAGLTLLLPATDGADGDGDAGRVEPSASSAPVHMPLGALLAFIVGVASGVVGAGGAFLLIPLMLHVLRLPLRVTVTSSLATVFLSSLGGAVGKLASASLPLGPAAVLVTASLLGAPLGTRVSARVRARHLQALLAAAVLGTAVQIWYAILT